MDASGRYLLRWTEPGGAQAERELPQGQLTLGRSSSCDLVLADQRVSRQHARVVLERDMLVIHDLKSRNGTFVNGERIESANLSTGDEITVGGLSLLLLVSGFEQTLIADRTMEATVVLDRVEPPIPAQKIGKVVPDDVLRQPVISESQLTAAGVEVKVAEYLALGGGIGSFVWVDFLRNSGVPAKDIVAVGDEEYPYGRYARLCQNSQIPHHERSCSNSDSCPDNIWGFPGYAVREGWRELKRGNIKAAAGLLWSIFGEPAIAQSYTPRSGDVFHAIDREAQRIGWDQIIHSGRLRALRHSDQGRLLAVVSQSNEQRRKHLVISARFVHIAVGYPAIQLLPDLADYRETYGDRWHIVNAYEDHDHVYTHLREYGGTVLIRGRGIVASRVIQRLREVRDHNQNIFIVHLHRSQLTVGHRYGWPRRAVRDQFEFQPFNWPKACWGGELRTKPERASDDRRKQLLDTWGGTTTASRRDWQRIVADGTRQGWYRPEFGVVRDVRPSEDGRVINRISTIHAGGTLELIVDFVIDCTGAVSNPDRGPFLKDLIETYDLPRTKLGGLQVNNDFEIEGLRTDQARAYASGITTIRSNADPRSMAVAMDGRCQTRSPPAARTASRSSANIAGAGAPAPRRARARGLRRGSALPTASIHAWRSPSGRRRVPA